MQLPEFGNNLTESISEPVECAPGRGLGELTVIHLHQVAGYRQGLGDRRNPLPQFGEGGRRERQGGKGVPGGHVLARHLGLLWKITKFVSADPCFVLGTGFS